MEPKSIPKRSKIEVDFQERKKVVQSASWGSLGAILGHLWRHLGVKQIDLSLVKNDDFEEDKRSRRVWDRTWLDFGAKKFPNGRSKGTQEAAKTKQK